MASTTFFTSVTSSANTTGQTATVVTAPPGGELHVGRIDIEIASGAGTDVTAQVFDGAQPVAPQDSPLSLADTLVSLPTDVSLSPADTLTLRHSNNSASDRAVSVVVVADEH